MSKYTEINRTRCRLEQRRVPSQQSRETATMLAEPKPDYH